MKKQINFLSKLKSAILIIALFIAVQSCNQVPKDIVKETPKETPVVSETPEYFQLRPKVEKEYGYIHAMRIGDGVLFYHSSCPEPGIAGLAEVASAPYTDPTQFEPKSDYYDSKAKRDQPRWCCVDVRALKKTRLMPLPELHQHAALKKLWALRPGNRLSITPVTAAEWKFISGKLA